MPNFETMICIKCDEDFEGCDCDEPLWGRGHDSERL